MEKDTLAASDKSMAALNGFCELLKERAIRQSLDALSADVLDRCNGFFFDHAELIAKHCERAEPAHIVSMVCGWILGMPGGEKATSDERQSESYQHNLIAAVVSAWSAENAARVYKKQ